MKYYIMLFLLLSGLCQRACAQADSMRYVDFHMHSSMKNYYRDVPHPDSMLNSKTFWATIDSPGNWDGIHHRNRRRFAKGRKFSGFYGRNSRPEASWDLISGMKHPPQVLCTSITPIEKKFTSEHFVHLGLFGFKLPARFINKLLVTRLPGKRQKVIYEGTSFDELMAEIEYMKKQLPNPKPGKDDVRLVTDAADLRKAINEHQTALVLTVEGAHSLHGEHTVGKEFDTTFGLDESGFAELSKNVETLKHLPNHVFFMTFSHMSWNALCGQAKSLDMKNKLIRHLLGFNSDDKRFRRVAAERYSVNIDDSVKEYHRADDAFAIDPCKCNDPVIRQRKIYGLEVLRMLLDSSGGQHRILIDMRHLAVEGRKQYIDTVMSHRNDMRDTIPLIVSHAAVSGKTYEQASLYGKCPFQDRYLEVQHPKKFYSLYKPCLINRKDTIPEIKLEKSGWFHPFSINLYDEEIECVYESGGIIGITLEERVLGTGRYNYSRKHYDTLRKAFKSWPLMRGQADAGKSYKELKIMEPFMRNLLYILRHSGSPGVIKSWEHIAIGSDWDGMIDPLDVCASPEDLPHFYSLLEYYLPLYARLYGNEDLLLPQAYTTQQLLNRLFFENGEKFILKHFK